MIVYVLTDGEYSDYHIETVKLDKTEAEKLIKIHPDWMLEEYDTDEITIKESYLYRVHDFGDGQTSAYTIGEYEDSDEIDEPEHVYSAWCPNHWRVNVRAEDAEHALKKGLDLIAKAKYREIEEAKEYVRDIKFYPMQTTQTTTIVEIKEDRP